DQVGPFARMVLDGAKVDAVVDGKKTKLNSLSTSWGERDGRSANVRAVPDVMLVPLYHKIRIPFEAVHDVVVRFDSFVEKLRPMAQRVLRARLEWDIYLTTANELKGEILRSSTLNGADKCRILEEPMPR